jgi:hypothetical protein
VSIIFEGNDLHPVTCGTIFEKPSLVNKGIDRYAVRVMTFFRFLITAENRRKRDLDVSFPPVGRGKEGSCRQRQDGVYRDPGDAEPHYALKWISRANPDELIAALVTVTIRIKGGHLCPALVAVVA